MCHVCVYVWQEHQVRATDATEYLANLGLYGALVSGVQCALLDRPEPSPYP